MVKNFLINIIKLFLITSLLTSCAAIPGGKVKLEDYPKITNTINDAKNISLAIDYTPFSGEEDLSRSFALIGSSLLTTKNDRNTKCIVKVSSKTDAESRKLDFLDLFKIPYYVACQLSLTTIPCYKQIDYQAKATLISLSQSPILDINGNPIKNPISPNPIEEKVLKEYYLEDKVHEVWSLFFIFGSFGIKNKYIDVGRRPVDAENEVKQTLSQALTRQILHDASKFPECIKTQRDKELEKQLAQEEKKQQEAIKKEQELRRSKIKGKSNINLKLQKDFSLTPSSSSSPTTH